MEVRRTDGARPVGSFEGVTLFVSKRKGGALESV
jgi:hypothetical protein